MNTYSSSAAQILNSEESTVVPNHIAVHALLLLMTLLVAGSFPIGASMMAAVDQSGLKLGGSELMLLRFMLASLLFAPYVLVAHGWRLPTRQALSVYTLLALPLVIFFSCMFASLSTTTALNTGALFTLVPTFTALFAWLINGEHSSGRRKWGLVLGTLGALWVVFRGDFGALLSFEFNRGDKLFLLGCVFLAVYQPLVKHWALPVPVAVMTFWVIIMGAVWLLLVVGLKSWLIDYEQTLGFIDLEAVLSLPSLVYWGLLYLALFTTLLSFFAQQLGALTIGPPKTAAYSLLTPSLVMIISVWVDPALFSWVLMPGVVLVMAGLLFLQFEPAES